MSVDLSLIIPNDCRSLRDLEGAKKYFNDTLNHIFEYFHGHEQFVTDITIRSFKDDPHGIQL